MPPTFPKLARSCAASITNFRLAVEYDGSEFYGFQWQPGERTVAAVLENALERLSGEVVKITGAGRTDSGVHATGQVVSFSIARRFPVERLTAALNALLPRDVSVRDAAEVDDGFSARFSARRRTYVYAILLAPERSALTGRFAWVLPRALDFDAMRAGAAALVGEHDFRAFSAPAPEPAVRNVFSLEIEPSGRLVRVFVAADGFLRHMVRVVVGTLVECAQGRRDPAGMAAVLESADRNAAGVTAPPQGLYLAGVQYPDGYDSFAEPPILGAQGARLDGARAFP